MYSFSDDNDRRLHHVTNEKLSGDDSANQLQQVTHVTQSVRSSSNYRAAKCKKICFYELGAFIETSICQAHILPFLELTFATTLRR
jgi:hypothetical protein